MLRGIQLDCICDVGPFSIMYLVLLPPTISFFGHSRWWYGVGIESHMQVGVSPVHTHVFKQHGTDLNRSVKFAALTLIV